MPPLIERILRALAGRPPRLRKGATTAEKGRFGEALAARYCRRKLGLRLLARNWRSGRDEVDLVCLDGKVLVFIEVRSRSAGAKVPGYHSVDSRKKEILLRAFRTYLRALPKPPEHFRFDIVDVALSETGEGEVRHYANVPIFPKNFHAQS